MRFAFTDEQDALRAEARRFLSKRVNIRAQDPTLLREIARLGWLEPSDEGLGFVERCILFEETGRALLPGAFLPTTVAAMALHRSGGDVAAPADGSAAYAELPDADIGDATIKGEARAVLGAPAASLLVVRVGLKLYSSTSFTVDAVETADLTRPAADVRIDGPATELPGADVPGLHARAATLVAAESVGVAQAALDMAVAYASQREQFGAPIGSFQAIKHKAADVLRAVTQARLLTYRAALAIADGEPSHAVAVSMAKATANDAVLLATAENIQIHGGIGVTWEHDAHLYYRRALANQALFGETAVNRDRVALALLGEVER